MENGIVGEVQTIENPRRRARRRGQRGSKFKRGDTWTIIYRTRDGKQKWEGGFRTSEAAQTRLDEVLGAIRNNKYVEPTDRTFKEFCDEFMESAKPILRPATWGAYQSSLKNWIVPAFGDQPLCDIRKADVLKFLYGLLGDQSISQKFVKNVHVLLHRLFEAAIERELLAANPAHKIKVPNAAGISGAVEAKDRVVPKPVEVTQTFEKLTPAWRVLLATGAVTGVRRGELLGLYWEDIDWTHNKIHVQRALQRVTKKFMDSGRFRNVERIGQSGLAVVPLKTKKSVRFVDMPPYLAEELKDLRQRQNGSSAPFVFQTEVSNPIDPDAVNRVLHAAQDLAGVRQFGLHGLRHLYCSLFQEKGASLKLAQDRLGHADASTTANIYTHLVNDQGGEIAEKVEAEFGFASVSKLLANPETQKPEAKPAS
jgi:integrase